MLDTLAEATSAAMNRGSPAPRLDSPKMEAAKMLAGLTQGEEPPPLSEAPQKQAPLKAPRAEAAEEGEEESGLPASWAARAASDDDAEGAAKEDYAAEEGSAEVLHPNLSEDERSKRLRSGIAKVGDGRL